MAELLRSVMSNECSTLVAAITTVLHAVGMYGQHWSEMYPEGNHEMVLRHQGLWRSCFWNVTGQMHRCHALRNDSAWLLSVQILVAVSFGMTTVATFLKMLYHFNPSLRSSAFIQGFILLGIFSGFFLLLAVSIYAGNYKKRYPHMNQPHPSGHHSAHLGWTFTVEVTATAFTVAAALMALCERSPISHSEYQEI